MSGANVDQDDDLWDAPADKPPGDGVKVESFSMDVNEAVKAVNDAQDRLWDTLSGKLTQDPEGAALAFTEMQNIANFVTDLGNELPMKDAILSSFGNLAYNFGFDQTAAAMIKLVAKQQADEQVNRALPDGLRELVAQVTSLHAMVAGLYEIAFSMGVIVGQQGLFGIAGVEKSDDGQDTG